MGKGGCYVNEKKMYLTYPNLIHIHPSTKRQKRIENEAFDVKSHCIPERNVLVWKYFIPSLYGGCKT